MNRFLCIFLCVFFLFNYSYNVFASSDDFVSTGYNCYESFSTVDDCWNYLSNPSSYVYIASYHDIGSRFALEFYVYETFDDCVFVRTERSTNYYYYTLYRYDSDTSTIVSVPYIGTVLYDDNYNYISCDDSNGYSVSLHKYNDIVLNSDTTGSFVPSGIPIAASTDYALAYFQHMDYSYLENADQFIEVPAPEDVAMYEASSENAIYVYWENTEGLDGIDSITDNSKQTVIEYGYYYENVDGEMKFITGDVIEEILPYSKRTQYFIDTSPLYGYENGYIIGRIRNRWSLGGIGSYLDSPYVEFYYIPYLDEYRIYYLDEDGNYIKKCVYPLNDYGVKNDSFTGGAIPESDLLVSDSGDVDYGFFTYLFNGFGLLGSNGLISLLGSLFSYLPKELINILLAGVSAAVVITLFKLFSKA